MTNGRLVELTRDWSVDQPARPPAHPSRLSTLVTGEPVNVFITGAQGADGNIIIANKEIYRQLVFTSSATLSGLWGGHRDTTPQLHSHLWLKIFNKIIILRSPVPASAQGEVSGDDADQQLQQAEVGLPREEQGPPDDSDLLAEGRSGRGGG